MYINPDIVRQYAQEMNMTVSQFANLCEVRPWVLNNALETGWCPSGVVGALCKTIGITAKDLQPERSKPRLAKWR